MTEYNKQTLNFLLIVLGLLAIGLGIPIGIITFKNIKFLNNSAVVNGIVQEYKNTPLRRAESPQHTDHLGTTVYKVVAYTVNGINYTTSSTSHVSESLANKKSIGTQIRIRYEKANPANSNIDSWFEVWNVVVVLVIIGIVITVPVVFAIRNIVVNDGY